MYVAACAFILPYSETMAVGNCAARHAVLPGLAASSTGTCRCAGVLKEIQRWRARTADLGRITSQLSGEPLNRQVAQH